MMFIFVFIFTCLESRSTVSLGSISLHIYLFRIYIYIIFRIYIYIFLHYICIIMFLQIKEFLTAAGFFQMRELNVYIIYYICTLHIHNHVWICIHIYMFRNYIYIIHICTDIYKLVVKGVSAAKTYMGWLRLVGSIKSYVSFAKEPYKRDYILLKRPIIWRSLLIVATISKGLSSFSKDSCDMCTRLVSNMHRFLLMCVQNSFYRCVVQWD